MAAPTVIKWTDPGAPALTRTAGSLIGVLDYCLPQRGWVKAFSGTNKAVYRAGSGERKFYRVLNDGSFYYSSVEYRYCHAKITAYDSMSAVDTGAGRWEETFFSLSGSGTAVPRPWMCIFGEKAVLIITMPHETTDVVADTFNSLIVGFGETEPFVPTNAPRSFLAGHVSSNVIPSPLGNYSHLSVPGTYALGGNGTTAHGRMRCSRSIDGTRLSVIVGLNMNGGFSGDPVDNASPFGLNLLSLPTYPYNGELLYGRPFLDDGIIYSIGDYVPWLYYPCHKGGSFNNWGVYSSGAAQFIAIRVPPVWWGDIFTTTDYGAVLVKITEDI